MIDPQYCPLCGAHDREWGEGEDSWTQADVEKMLEEIDVPLREWLVAKLGRGVS